MTRQELQALVDAHYNKLDVIQQRPAFLSFQRQLTHVWTTWGQHVLQASVDKPPVNPQTKRLSNPIRTC
ncbi:hypothetical protein CWM47_33965 [Spirosoma pollinicola]|uniref:Uncharacterized protein n=1 Tax=Spirosoma pollinicola TaxID=2057025 RepID=A0A2K8Z964_9BACT|nr:hypothetical protein CWM47_33965 [Spirosoma pollinicola]